MYSCLFRSYRIGAMILFYTWLSYICTAPLISAEQILVKMLEFLRQTLQIAIIFSFCLSNMIFVVIPIRAESLEC